MGRLPRKVDEIVHHRTGVKVALRWNKKTDVFEASYAGQRVHSRDAKEVRDKIQAMIETGHELTWEPVIELKVETLMDRKDFYGGDKTGAGLEVAYRRFYISKADRLRRIQWDHWEDQSAMRIYTPDGYHQRAMDFPLPYILRKRQRGIFMVLAYDEDTWKRIVDLAETIKGFAQHLMKCVAPDQETDLPALHSVENVTDQLNQLTG